jgi:hypothetical protein
MRGFRYFMIRRLLWVFLWACYAPIALGIAVAKLATGRWLFRDTVQCPTCGEETSLLGFWKCSRCGFRFYGFYFSSCRLCRNVPAFLDCESCGASILNPLL